jgi:hypothetical protein
MRYCSPIFRVHMADSPSSRAAHTTHQI